MPFRRRPPPGRAATIARKGVVASATPVRKRGEGLRRLSQHWQEQAFKYYDKIGECWYPAQSYAWALEKTRYFPAVLNERGEVEESEDAALVDLFSRIRDPGGTSMSGFAGAYGRLQFVIGDGYTLVSSDEDGQEQWEYLSPFELKIKPDSGIGRPQEYARLRAQGLQTEDLVEASDDDFDDLDPSKVRVYRFWRRHPMFTEMADSPIRALLDLYELLHRLTLAAAAESQSRAASRGMLYVPWELALESLNPAHPDEDPEADPFLSRLLDGLVNAISDPGSAGAMAPFVVRGPGTLETANGVIPMKDALGWFPLGPAQKYFEGEMWDKVIARISYGLDMPSEFITGTGDTNHWGGWLLDEQGYRKHVSPVTQRLCDDLASAYLRPAAIEAGVPDAERVVVGYDPAEAVNHPDESQTAREAYELGLVSLPYVLDKIGATEEDQATDDDREWILKLKGKAPLEDEEPEGETPPDEGGGGGDTEEGAPAQEDADEPAQRNGKQPVAASALVVAKILGAAEVQVKRARAVAGSRLVSRSKGCEPCREAIKGTPAQLVASTLGPEQVREVIAGHTTEAALVAGVGDELADTLREWGVREDWPVKLGGMVEQHALRHLYSPQVPPLPTGFLAAVQKAVA